MSATYLYCDIARVQNILGATGTTLRLDDVPPDQYGDAVNQACDDIDEACWERYSPDQLLSSDWVATIAATLAAWYLSTRRGNSPPGGIALREKRAREKLQKVKDRSISIPRLAQLKSYAPVMSNMSTVMRPFPRATVEKTRSTGTPANYSDTTSRDPYDRVGANLYLDFMIALLLYVGPLVVFGARLLA